MAVESCRGGVTTYDTPKEMDGISISAPLSPCLMAATEICPPGYLYHVPFQYSVVVVTSLDGIILRESHKQQRGVMLRIS